MTEFKVGYKVRIRKRNLNYLGQCDSCGLQWNERMNEFDGSVDYISGERNKFEMKSIGDRWVFCSHWLELVDKKSNIMSDLATKFKMFLKSEPEKSFIKAGITNLDGSLTAEG